MHQLLLGYLSWNELSLDMKDDLDDETMSSYLTSQGAMVKHCTRYGNKATVFVMESENLLSKSLHELGPNRAKVISI